MSDLTPTNAESLARIKQRAKKDGKAVTVLADAHWGMGGMNVYVHPKGLDIRSMSGGEDGPRSKYRVAWMMEI
jgi:hypothetical protein